VDQGSQASALLVADRFQVKVIGQGNGMDSQQRHALLAAFDVASLAALNPAIAPAIPAGREARAPGLRLPLPRFNREAPQAKAPTNQARPSRSNRANAVLEPAA
jgi:hypothetical protein